MNRRPSLLFYCQHSLGMGHLVRSLTLAEELASRFRVVLLNGGRFPKGVVVPDGVEVVDLPPLGLDEEGRLVCRDRRRSLERARAVRRRTILEAYHEARPRVVLVELFPFGRKKFADELLPLLETARDDEGARPAVVCSLRDILVGREDQQRYDERAVELANRYFDAVLVHADPRFVRIEESLRSATPLQVPVYHTGFVAPRTARSCNVAPRAARRRQVVVSAGGGVVGESLLRAAADAHAVVWREERLRTRLVAGPFLPEPVWRSLRAAADGTPGLSVRRFVRDLSTEIRGSSASVSQCGYNTVLDILRARTPALVVPFGEGTEDEQSRRAARLERLGLVRMLRPEEMTPARLADEIRALGTFEPSALELDLDGARKATRVVDDLAASAAEVSR
jgi:predicted glycosyltransferase